MSVQHLEDLCAVGPNVISQSLSIRTVRHGPSGFRWPVGPMTNETVIWLKVVLQLPGDEFQANLKHHLS